TLIAATRRRGGDVIAVGTSVVRALEHAAIGDAAVRVGPGLATQRIGPHSRLRIADAIVSGTHERGTSHFELLRGFQDDQALRRMEREADEQAYTTHEYGDSVLIYRKDGGPAQAGPRVEPFAEPSDCLAGRRGHLQVAHVPATGMGFTVAVTNS